MDPSIKNLREWIGLLFALFCVLDIAGVQYGMSLAQSAPLHPNPVVGQIVAMIRGPRGAYFNVYVTSREMLVFYAFLGGSALSLLGALGLIVTHGIRHLRTQRKL